MNFGKVYYSDYPDNPPAWYWIQRLHDACVVSVESFDFPFDYNKFVGEKSRCTRNLLRLKIDAEGAMFDTNVKEIRFINYKILSENISLEGRNKMWWLAARLIDHGDSFTLEIDLHDFDSDPEEFTFIIKFERAEVDRN